MERKMYKQNEKDLEGRGKIRNEEDTGNYTIETETTSGIRTKNTKTKEQR